MTKEPTLFDGWVEVNEHFLTTPVPTPVIASAGVYTTRTRVSVHATGFGLPDDLVLLRDARVRLLADRYIEPGTWERCYQRYATQPKGASHTFLFNRQGDRPKAGGCLLSIVLAKAGGKYEVMVTSRAVEATMAFLADIAFVKATLERLNTDLSIGMDVEGLQISWHFGVVHQNRVFVPVFIYEAYGARYFAKWVHYHAKARNKWDGICIAHSQAMVMNKGVTGARQLWGKRLKEWVYGEVYPDFSQERARPPIRAGR